MAEPTTININPTMPEAPAGYKNVIPQADAATPERNASMYMPVGDADGAGAWTANGDHGGTGKSPVNTGIQTIQVTTDLPTTRQLLYYDTTNANQYGRGGILKWANVLGGVDARTTVSETITDASRGMLVTLTNASTIAVSLDSTVDAFFACQVEAAGAGAATLTPSTGTINGAASLVVPAGSSGWLWRIGSNWHFVPTGSGGSASPTTTKGDLIVRDASADTRLAVGSNGKVLMADSSQTTGLKWAQLAESDITSLVSDLANLIPLTYLDTDSTFAANSDSKIATQKAVKTALALKAALASPTFTGTPTAPTVGTSSDSSTKLATTAFVQSAITGIGGGTALSPVLVKPVSTDFTWTNQLSTTVTDTTPGMFFDMPTNATDPNWRLFKYNTSLPSTPYSVVMAFDHIIGDTSYAEISLSLRNAGSGKFIDLNWNMGGSTPTIRLLQFNSVTSVSTAVTRAAQPRWGVLSFFKITDDGTNRKYWYSPNGFNYWLVASEATGTFVTPDTACIGCANFTGGTRQFTVWHWQVVNAII